MDIAKAEVCLGLTISMRRQNNIWPEACIINIVVFRGSRCLWTWVSGSFVFGKFGSMPDEKGCG